MYSLLLKRWKLFHYVNEGLQRYQHLPRFSLICFSQDCSKYESTAQTRETQNQKKILKTIFLKRIHIVLVPFQTFHFNKVFKNRIDRCIIFSLLVHCTSPSSPFPPVPVVNIMSRDTTPFTKCLYHFVPPTTWEMKIITKPHPKVLPPRDL